MQNIKKSLNSREIAKTPISPRPSRSEATQVPIDSPVTFGNESLPLATNGQAVLFGSPSAMSGLGQRPRRNSTPILTPATKVPLINYKNILLLQRFMSEQGKIISRKITGIGAKEQRKISKAIKHARIMGMLPFVSVK